MQWLTSARVGFALVGALYLLSFPYHPGLRSPNELCRLWQARSLVDFGTLSINGTMAELGPVGDLSCVAVVEEAGVRRNFPCVGPDVARAGTLVAQHYYPSKAPLVSFLGAPVYWVLTRLAGPVSELEQVFWSRLFVTVLPALGLLWLLRRVLSAFASQALTDTLTVVYALGTMAFSYAQTFMSHQLTAVLLFATFYAAWQVERGHWRERGYLLAGALAGAVVACEYTGALGVVCVAAYVLAARWRQWPKLLRAVGLVVLGALPLLVALMAYHQAAFGGVLTSGYKYLNDANYQHWHQGGFLGIRAPDPQAFVLSLFSPLRGLFALSPFLIGAVWGTRELRGDRPTFVLLVALLGANAYFTSSFAYDSWGWTVGPRHLTPLLPFLMLPLGAWLRRLELEAPRRASVLGGLCVSSVLATGLAAFVNYVPDDVSTSVFGLTVPLLAQGVWPVSWLAAWVPNPASGAVLVGLLLASTLWVASRVMRAGAVRVVVVAVVVAHVGLLKLATKNDDHDVAARRFLTSVWLAPVGQRVRF